MKRMSSTGIGRRPLITPAAERAWAPTLPDPGVVLVADSESWLVRSSANGGSGASATTMLPRAFSMIVVPIGFSIVTPAGSPAASGVEPAGEHDVGVGDAGRAMLRISTSESTNDERMSNSNVAPDPAVSEEIRATPRCPGC